MDIVATVVMMALCTIAIVISLAQPNIMAMMMWVALFAVNLTLLLRSAMHPCRHKSWKK